MNGHETSRCIESIESLGFKPSTKLNIFCQVCTDSIKVISDKIIKFEIAEFLNKHRAHDCFFGFSDGRGKWKIPNNGGSEFQQTEPMSQPTTPEEPLSKSNPEPNSGGAVPLKSTKPSIVTRKEVVADSEIFEGDSFEDETWIKLYRKFIKNPIFKDSAAVHLWVYLLLKANHKSNRFLFNKKEILVRRGQLITGLYKISRDTGISEWRVRERLKAFEGLDMTTSKTTNKFRIITICNYNEHQDSIPEKPQAKPQAVDSTKLYPRPQSTHNQPTTNKNVKNVKSIKKGRASKKKDADPRVKEFFSYWGEIFQRETGQPYVFSFGKDGKLMKDLLQVHPLETLQSLTESFFKDEQCKRRGLIIGIFFQEINRLLSQKAMNPLEEARKRPERQHPKSEELEDLTGK